MEESWGAQNVRVRSCGARSAATQAVRECPWDVPDDVRIASTEGALAADAVFVVERRWKRLPHEPLRGGRSA